MGAKIERFQECEIAINSSVLKARWQELDERWITALQLAGKLKREGRWAEHAAQITVVEGLAAEMAAVRRQIIEAEMREAAAKCRGLNRSSLNATQKRFIMRHHPEAVNARYGRIGEIDSRRGGADFRLLVCGNSCYSVPPRSDEVLYSEAVMAAQQPEARVNPTWRGTTRPDGGR